MIALKRILLAFSLAIAMPAQGTDKVVLAADGIALFPITIAPTASAAVRDNAETLAAYLEKITGAKFSVETGDGSRGIVLGVAGDFCKLPQRPDFVRSDPLRTEDYLLFSHAEGLLLVGASDLGAQNALWDFLHRQGYRQYFPSKTWEIVPRMSKMEAQYNDLQKPDYSMRSIWSSGGIYPERSELFKDWSRKNRMQSGVHINAGHSYGSILSKNQDFFRANPDYLTHEGKPCLWRPEVRRFFVEQYLEIKRQNPETPSISVDPSDGGGWDDGPEARAFGSVSDQVVTLANETAEALQRDFPGTLVGLYAYNVHAAPPTLPVHPKVNVLVATKFRKTPLSLSEQIQGWSEKGATTGIRDYLSYPAMDYDVPSRAIGISGIEPFLKNWRNYHQLGARYYSGEAQDNWGINGLLYYAAARALWDTSEPLSREYILKEFLENCFGPVKEAIRPYYEELSTRPANDEDTINRLYSAIREARGQTRDRAILDRLNDLTLYVRYLELNNRYSQALGPARRKAAEAMFTHLYRGRLHSANHARGIMRDLGIRTSIAESPAESRSLRSGIPPWSPNVEPYTDEEIHAMVGTGLAENPRLGFEIKSYSADLVPGRSLFPDTVDPEDVTQGAADRQALYYTWTDKPDSTWKIRFEHQRDEHVTVKAEIWSDEEAEEKPVATQELEVAPGTPTEVILTSPHTGRHRVFLSGPKIGDSLEADPTHPWTISVGREAPIQTLASMRMNDLFFYVPKGTRLIAARVGQGRGNLINPEGQVAARINNEPIVRVDVPHGMDGRLWKVTQWRGRPFALLTVPPYLAHVPSALLLPREVVESDTKRPHDTFRGK